jgi:hypothetical protein
MAAADDAGGAEERADGAAEAAPPADDDAPLTLTRRVSFTLHTELLRKFKLISGAGGSRAARPAPARGEAHESGSQKLRPFRGSRPTQATASTSAPTSSRRRSRGG